MRPRNHAPKRLDLNFEVNGNYSSTWEFQLFWGTSIWNIMHYCFESSRSIEYSFISTCIVCIHTRVTKKKRHASSARLPRIFYGSVKTLAFSQYQKVGLVNNRVCLCTLRPPGDLEPRLNNSLFEYHVNLTGSSGLEIGTTVPIVPIV